MDLSVETTELEKVSQKFTSLSGEYTTVYTRLLNTANTMGDAYKSPDNLVFVSQINGLCEHLKAMAGHLDAASQILKMQADGYDTTSLGLADAAKRLPN